MVHNSKLISMAVKSAQRSKGSVLLTDRFGFQLAFKTLQISKKVRYLKVSTKKNKKNGIIVDHYLP